MPTVRIQEKNYSESIMVLKLKDGYISVILQAKSRDILYTEMASLLNVIS